MRVCVCVCVYIYLYIYIILHDCIQWNKHIYTFFFLSFCVYIYIYIYAQKCVCVFIYNMCERQWGKCCFSFMYLLKLGEWIGTKTRKAFEFIIKRKRNVASDKNRKLSIVIHSPWNSYEPLIRMTSSNVREIQNCSHENCWIYSEREREMSGWASSGNKVTIFYFASFTDIWNTVFIKITFLLASGQPLPLYGC